MLSGLVRTGTINVAIRGGTLFLRFALSFYVVGQLGLAAAGVYGLAVGVIAIVPAALGWGLNYFVSREVVGESPASAAPLIRDRLIVTVLSLSAGTIVSVPIINWGFGGVTQLAVLIFILVWLETIALDIYMPLIGLERALFANILVFIRSAVWIPLVILFGYYFPSVRSIDSVFIAWITCHIIANLIFVFYSLRLVPKSAFLTKLNIQTLALRSKKSWYIYFSDIGIVGLGYADRFVVNALLGLAATGIYSFYFSISNALQTLVATAVVQLALPRMVRASRGGDLDEWKRELRRQMLKTLTFCGVLSIIIFSATEFIFFIAPSDHFPVYRSLLAVMLIAATIRSGSDLLNVSITSMGHDKMYAAGNIGGALIAIAYGFSFMWFFGLFGAGLSAVATATTLFMIRSIYLRYELRKTRLINVR